MSCPTCHAEAKEWGSHNGTPILRCTAGDCGFRFFDLSRWKSPYEAGDYYQDWQPETFALKPWIQARVDILRRFRTAGKVADLGCGAGETAIALQQAGYDVTGVEESEKAVRHLTRQHPEIHCYNEDILSFLRDRPGSFDAVTMFHVLEHIPDPARAVALMASALHPDGVVIIEVPDVGGGWARLRGKKWDYYLDHHVNYFDMRSLRRLFGAFGFRLAYLQRTYHFSHPQGALAKDIIKGALGWAGLNSIVRTAWTR